MNRMTRVVALGLLALVLLVGGVGAAALPRPEPLGYRLSGTLNIVSGDLEDLSGPPVEVFTLVTAEGQETRLILGPELRAGLDLYSLNGLEVIVTGAAGDSGQATQSGESPDSIVVTAIEPAPGAREAGAAALTGNTKWLSIACKFADIPDEPKTLSYFQNMYGTTYPGLDAYWQEASYGNINLAGSQALGWFTLPKPMSAYQIDDESVRLTDLFLDCAALVDPLVNFNDYTGVNLMLNGKPGCCAWGGYRTVTLDGVHRKWSVTWLPPFAYADLGYLQHEMTHAYGILWHSYANDNAYGDPWDVVSSALANCCVGENPVYGWIGQHTQAYHRRYLGWLPESRVVTVSGDKTTLTLERATQPGATGPLMAIIPIDGAVDHYYALEARRRVGFDGHLMGDSITIHEIGGARHTVQLMDPYAIGGSYGDQVWDAGDTWVAPEGGITVHVDAITPTGFTITVRTGLETRTLVMPVIADTYIDHEAPQTNFGTSTILKTRGALFPDSLLAKATILKFEPASLPQNVARAHLRLTLAEGTTGGHLPRVESKYTMPSWEEAVLTWENAPQAIFGFSEPYVFQPTVTGTNWMEWDISGITAVRGSEALSALVVDNGLFTFSSREGPNPPQLIVDYLVEPTAALTLTPVNDAHVNELYPTTVYGDGPGLRVRNAATDQNAYVKFNLKSVDKAVQKATLRLYVTDAGPDGGGLYRVSPTYPGTTTQWLETDITWLNAPPISGAPITQIGAVVAGKWVELDVTGAAQAAMTDFNGRLSLALRSGASDLVVYSSKEGEHAPELVLKLGNNPPPPTSTPTATATNTPKPSPTATASPTVTPSPTMTPSPTVTMSPTVTVSPTPSPTMTPSPTPTSGPSPTPSATATAGPSPTPTATRPAEPLWRVFLPFAARPSVPTP